MSNKSNLKLVLLPIVVVLLLGGILIYFFINRQPKPVATYEQVWSAVENQGIIPTDTTEMFIEAWNDSRSETSTWWLHKAVARKF